MLIARTNEEREATKNFLEDMGYTFVRLDSIGKQVFETWRVPCGEDTIDVDISAICKCYKIEIEQTSVFYTTVYATDHEDAEQIAENNADELIEDAVNRGAYDTSETNVLEVWEDD